MTEPTAEQMQCGHVLYGPPALCTCGTCEGAPPADYDEMAMRAILAEEVKERGGPQDYIAMLGNRWMEIDSELPPELSAALAAMLRAWKAGRELEAKT